MKFNDLLMGLIGHLRAMQLFYHEKHHTAEGASFFADHEAFGGFYGEVESDFDSVVERAMGLGFVDAAFVRNHMSAIHAVLQLDDAVEMEKQLCELCELIIECEECTEGTEQAIGEIANKSEVRQYKLARRGE